MSTMTCKLFGVPQILKDGQPVFLPYSKINALLYYILVSKVVSREELAGLLWPDETDETARRNLRNAIYQAKKALGTNIILSPKKSLLMLNENLDLTLDIDQFLQAPQENLHLYTGEFLQGFFLKGAETYEYWIVKMRNYYKEKFFSECYQKVADDLDARRYDQVETHIRYLMELDEYDERAFRLLLRFYQETGRNGKVIESYYEFAKLLRRELGVAPDQTTKEIYERALEQMHFETGRVLFLRPVSGDRRLRKSAERIQGKSGGRPLYSDLRGARLRPLHHETPGPGWSGRTFLYFADTGTFDGTGSFTPALAADRP